MRIFTIKLPTNLEELLNLNLSFELERIFVDLIELEEKLYALLKDLNLSRKDNNPNGIVCVKLLGFFEEEKIFINLLLQDEDLIEKVAISLRIITDRLLEYNRKILLSDNMDNYIFLKTIKSIKICISFDE